MHGRSPLQPPLAWPALSYELWRCGIDLCFIQFNTYHIHIIYSYNIYSYILIDVFEVRSAKTEPSAQVSWPWELPSPGVKHLKYGIGRRRKIVEKKEQFLPSASRV